jgi:hypothetical protein
MNQKYYKGSQLKSRSSIQEYSFLKSHGCPYFCTKFLYGGTKERNRALLVIISYFGSRSRLCYILPLAMAYADSSVYDHIFCEGDEYNVTIC